LYQRVILKLSGELFASPEEPVSLTRAMMLGTYIHNAIQATKCQMGIVVGGGNIIRGRNAQNSGVDRAIADYMGMPATAINGLALREALSRYDYDVRLTNALTMPHISEQFSHMKVAHHFEAGRIVIFAGGLGRPFHSTDSAAAQAAAEFRADIILKASTVNGVYNRDPKKDASAVRYAHLTYQEAIIANLGVMDQEAFAACRNNDLTLLVFHADDLLRLSDIIAGDVSLGTLITN